MEFAIEVVERKNIGVSAQSHHPCVRASPNGSFSTNTWVSFSLIISLASC